MKVVLESKCQEVSIVLTTHTSQKMKFSIKDFLSKCDQIRRKLRIWPHLLKKSLIENFISCAVAAIFCYIMYKYCLLY